MRVCLISTAHDARDDRLYYKEACSLAKEHDVTVFAPLLREGGEWKNKQISFVRMNSAFGKIARIMAVLRLPLWLRKNRFDVVHIVDYDMMPMLPIIKWCLRPKVVYDVWEANYEMILESNSLPRGLRRITATAFRFLDKQAARVCDVVLTADCSIAKAFDGLSNIVVVKNYPLLSALSTPEESIQKIREEMGSRRCVIYQGAMTELRGVVSAVLSIALVRKSHPDVTLLLVGRLSDDLKRVLDREIGRLGIQDSIRCIDWVDHSEVGKYLAICEVGLVPFKATRKFKKNIPQKIFEYWAFGLPVLATDLPPIRHFVGQCDGGLLLKESDPQSLADGICYLLEHREEAKAMGARGKHQVEEVWRWETMEQQLLNAYRRIGCCRNS